MRRGTWFKTSLLALTEMPAARNQKVRRTLRKELNEKGSMPNYSEVMKLVKLEMK